MSSRGKSAGKAASSKQGKQPVVRVPAAPAPGLTVGKLLWVLLPIGLLVGGALGYRWWTHEPPAAALGSLLVRSSPSGAAIWIDGQDSQQSTPHQFDDLPLDTLRLIAVRKAEHRASPEQQSVQLSAAQSHAVLDFDLERVRVYRVESQPAGASVVLDGKTVGLTPLDLPPLVVDQSYQLVVEAKDHAPARQSFDARSDDAQLKSFTLVRARTVSVASQPLGAAIFVNGKRVGYTPLADLQLPMQGKLKIAIKKHGLKPWSRRYRNARAVPAELKTTLLPVPLPRLPLSGDERREMKRLQKLLRGAQAARKKQHDELEKAQYKVYLLRRAKGAIPSEVVMASQRVETLSARTEQLEEAIEEAEQELITLRGMVVARMQEESPL